MASFLSDLANGLSGAASGASTFLNRFGTALLNPAGLTAQDEAKRKQESLAQLAPILSGQSIAEYARAGGAEPQTPEQTMQQQLAQLGNLGTPEATAILTNLSPLSQAPLSDIEKRFKEAQIKKLNAEAAGTGGDMPMSIKEFNSYQRMTPEQQQQFMDLKRQNLYDKPLPTPIVQLQDTLKGEIDLHKSIASNLGEFSTKIDKGDLKLDVIGNIENKVRNGLSISTAESRDLASFQSYLNKLRNDTIALQKGTQTEGDATRAWDELVSNINDPKVVKQRLTEIEKYNRIAGKLKEDRISAIRSEYKRGALPTTPEVPSQFTPTEAIPTGGNINAPITKVIGGKTYVQQNGKWFEQ